MNKPEPLKGKTYKRGNPFFEGKEVFHMDEDIRSAVEWLLNEIQNHDWTNKLDGVIMVQNTLSAFEDVMKAKGKED